MKIAGVIIVLLLCALQKHNNLPSSLANDIPLHFLRMHGFFVLPSPPNLGISQQNLRWLQSFILQPVHCLHLLCLFAVGNEYSLQLKLLGPNHYSLHQISYSPCSVVLSLSFFYQQKRTAVWMHDCPEAKREREWSLQVEQSLFHSGLFSMS